jgi:sugar lactone lactonase YvrE
VIGAVETDTSYTTLAGDIAMRVSGKNSRRLGDVRIALLVLCAGVLLAACKHNNNGMSKGLWVANGTTVLEYIPAQFTSGVVDAAPHLMISGGAVGTPQGVTFDSAGDLWVMDPGATVNGAANTPALLKFSAMQLAALKTSPNPEPTAIITSTSLAFPQQSVFDGKGNQWVADHNNNTILVFTAAQMMATGTNATVPAVVISSAAFNGPLGIVFDKAGNLWVANNGGVPGANGAMSDAGTSIVEFAAAHLPTPGSGMLTPDLTPDITLTDNGQNSIQSPWELAFDSAGNLWSSNAGGTFSLVEFAKATLAATGTPTPAVTINTTMDMGNPTLSATNGLCFDNAGDLAATSSATPFSIPFYKAPLKSGAITPSTFIIGAATTLSAPAGCNFGPLVN